MSNHTSAIQEVDIIDVIRSVGKRNKKLQAILLQEIERHVTDPDEYERVRKFTLDEINNYTRSIMRDIFGDIEYMIPN